MAINFSIGQYVSSISEIVGHKTGLCLNENDLSRLVNDFSETESEIFLAPKDHYIRIRSEDYEQIISWLLYKTGFTDRFYQRHEHIKIFHKYKNNDEKLNIYYDVFQKWIDQCNYTIKEFEKGKTKSINPVPVIEYSRKKYGDFGEKLALDIVMAFDREMQISPWARFQHINWKDKRKLEELFKSENLETEYGEFFDQRFIHYLINNFDDIGKIHWRQFEALACEYFDKLGFHVEIGSGRDDGGVDLRVWKDKSSQKGPANILVQCKRQKKKVEKVVVKALWADVLDEQADSGLIVTSSSISPGAREVCNARGYTINEANRGTLKKWLLSMRDPGNGIFMGE